MLGRPDLLLHAPRVVAQQHVGGGHDVGGTAVVHLERMLTRAGEQRAEADQPLRLGAVVAVDRLVVVADTEHRTVGPGEQANQQQVGRREVLELVDEHDPTCPLGCGAGAGVGEQHLDGALNLLVEVECVRSLELAPVPRQDLGEAIDLAVVHLLHLVGRAQT